MSCVMDYEGHEGGATMGMIRKNYVKSCGNSIGNFWRHRRLLA